MCYGALLGFMLGSWIIFDWPDAAYYMYSARAWEMMVGDVAFLFPIKVNKRVIEYLGLLLIAGSCLFIDEETIWPGCLALSPVCGAFIFIRSQRNDSFITDNRMLQSLGFGSYSIYLWHWPLVVLDHKYELDLNIYIYILLSISLGFVLFYFLKNQ